MKLRPYQEEAVSSVYDHLRRRSDNPCIVIPTGGGKTACIATICRDAVSRWNGRVLILAHVKELLQQSANTLHRMAPDVDFGVYSAGLNSRNTIEPVIIAGIQSVYNKACELGKFDLILIDESHLLPPDGEGRYQTFIKDAKIVNPRVRVVGFTATPYRMSTGMICAPGNVLNHVCYEKGVKELIREGYLCPIHTKGPQREIDCSNLHVRNGEFKSDEVAALFSTEEAVHSIFVDIFKNTKDRQSILIFCCDVAQAKLFQRELTRFSSESVGLITGDTPGHERADLIARFQRKNVGLFQEPDPLRWLVNVNVLTTGFDAPNVDCVALVRPTLSPGLYYQMVGRGFRTCEGKVDCLVLDYGSNIQRHGPVDAIEVRTKSGGGGTPPVRKCSECSLFLSINVSRCNGCGYVFPIPEAGESKLDDKASKEGVLSGQTTETDYEVQDVSYSVHVKRGAEEGDPRTMKIEYQIGCCQYVQKWVCPEHDGWTWEKRFVPWWNQRTDLPPPTNADEAVFYGKGGHLAEPKRITVIKTAGSRFPEIIEHDISEKPEIPETRYIPPVKQKTCHDCQFYYQGQCMDSRRDGELWGDEPACENGFTPLGEPYVFVNEPDDVPF